MKVTMFVIQSASKLNISSAAVKQRNIFRMTVFTSAEVQTRTLIMYSSRAYVRRK